MLLTEEDVYILIGDAELRRSRGETDMPKYSLDMPKYSLELAERIALTIGNKALAERVVKLRDAPPNNQQSERAMSTTVLEALQNAQINFETLGNSDLKANGIFLIAKDQLDNAIEALENGKEPDDVLQEHLGANVDTGA